MNIPRLLTFSVLSLSLLFWSPQALAQVSQNNGNITLTGPFQDDLYTAGSRVILDYPVLGDALIAGGFLEILGSIEEDLNAAGSYISIQDNIGDDLRVAGGYITLDAEVADDVIVTGGVITLSEDSVVNGNVYASGGMINLRGNVLGDVFVGGGIVDLGGTISGNLQADAGQVIIQGSLLGSAEITSDELRFQDEGLIEGDLNYWVSAGELGQLPVRGNTLFDESLQRSVPASIEKEVQKLQEQESKETSFDFSWYWLLSRALIVVLMALIFERFLEEALRELKDHPLSVFITGFVGMIAVPLAAIILMMTLIGFPLGGTLLVSYFFSWLFLAPLACVFIGRGVLDYLKYPESVGKLILSSLGTLVVYALIVEIPYIGILLHLVLALFAAGLFLTSIHRFWQHS
jgi:hypothetical protein